MAICGICKNSSEASFNKMILVPTISTDDKTAAIQAVVEQAIAQEETSTEPAIVLVGDSTPTADQVDASTEELDTFISLPLTPQKSSLFQSLKSQITKANLKSTIQAMAKASINTTKRTVTLLNDNKKGVVFAGTASGIAGAAAYKLHEYATYVPPVAIESGSSTVVGGVVLAVVASISGAILINQCAKASFFH